MFDAISCGIDSNIINEDNKLIIAKGLPTNHGGIHIQWLNEFHEEFVDLR